MIIFLTVLATIFIAEMGDKTQLLLVAMAGKYKIPHILTGTWLATVVLNLLAVGVGAALGSYLDMRIIKTVAGIAFFWFAYSALKVESGEEEEREMKHSLGPVLAIFGSFFIGELGDKTQLSAITLAANYTGHNVMNAVYVFLGCTLGLILADRRVEHERSLCADFWRGKRGSYWKLHCGDGCFYSSVLSWSVS